MYGLKQPPTAPREWTYSERLLRRTDKLILTNGELDPWMGGGVVRSPHRGVPAIVTPRASHRQDLSA